MSPPRVLFVTNYGDAKSHNASAGIFVDRQARSLREAGVDVIELDIGRNQSPLGLLKAWRALRREIERVRPDLLHAQYGTIVACVSVLTLHPTVITFSGNDLLPGASISFARTWAGILLSNFAALFARSIICVSEALRRALWWRRGSAVVIPRGVDLNMFTPGPRDEARRELGWDPAARIVVLDGGRDPGNKGLALVESAVARARAELPDLQLHVIRQVPPDRMPLYYRAADALVCASRAEGSPNVVKEALACALPVVGVVVGDVPERLAGVEPSIVVERTPEALANGIVAMVREPRRSNGREVVSAISLERVAERIAAVYEEAR